MSAQLTFMSGPIKPNHPHLLKMQQLITDVERILEKVKVFLESETDPSLNDELERVTNDLVYLDDLLNASVNAIRSPSGKKELNNNLSLVNQVIAASEDSLKIIKNSFSVVLKLNG
ncbi:hypothetical protein BM526_19215 (plasmid) [Alteromonas mediterranea]|uniref:hypothetical protein n=1 Tax=Alteromonas mediterranea TaxID=314275 RepID=UPI00090426D6|nr:hypothetical protein [Alteromonas mediterranea]APE04100.1 hypothetical protein BM526_19215 [Alteromonas mediterranea]